MATWELTNIVNLKNENCYSETISIVISQSQLQPINFKNNTQVFY